MQIALLVAIPVVLFFFGMSIYNLYHGGVLVKNKGWKTKEEAPISFWISVSFPFVITIFALWGIVDPDGLWNFVKTVLKPLDRFGIATP
jgi:hypothetical protein